MPGRKRRSERKRRSKRMSERKRRSIRKRSERSERSERSSRTTHQRRSRTTHQRRSRFGMPAFRCDQCVYNTLRSPPTACQANTPITWYNTYINSL